MTLIQLITVMNFLSIVITPGYLFLRRKMTRNLSKPKPKRLYTPKKIYQTILLNVSLLGLSLIIVLAMLLMIQTNNESKLDYYSLTIEPLTILFGICLLTIVYGSGIYITEIVNEMFTMKKLTEIDDFEVLNGAELLLHGPISHIMIYTGGIFVLMSLAFIEITHPPSIIGSLLPWYINGIISGTIFALAQIYNLTWKHQLVFLIGAMNIYLVIAIILQIDLYTLPFNYYFLLLLLSSSLILISKFAYYKLGNSNYVYQDLFKFLDTKDD